LSGMPEIASDGCAHATTQRRKLFVGAQPQLQKTVEPIVRLGEFLPRFIDIFGSVA